jgi:hypothetical protein
MIYSTVEYMKAVAAFGFDHEGPLAWDFFGFYFLQTGNL